MLIHKNNNMMEKPTCKLVGEDSNIFGLIGSATKALNRAGQREQASVLTERAFNAKSFDEALSIILEYVDPE